MMIYKVLRTPEWHALQAAGQTTGAPVDVADGFVHFSTRDQLAETLSKHFNGVEGLELLALDPTQLGDALKWEPSRGGALFPHLYGPLRLTDVIWHAPLPVQAGVHQIPDRAT